MYVAFRGLIGLALFMQRSSLFVWKTPFLSLSFSISFFYSFCITPSLFISYTLRHLFFLSFIFFSIYPSPPIIYPSPLISRFYLVHVISLFHKPEQRNGHVDSRLIPSLLNTWLLGMTHQESLRLRVTYFDRHCEWLFYIPLSSVCHLSHFLLFSRVMVYSLEPHLSLALLGYQNTSQVESQANCDQFRQLLPFSLISLLPTLFWMSLWSFSRLRSLWWLLPFRPCFSRFLSISISSFCLSFLTFFFCVSNYFLSLYRCLFLFSLYHSRFFSIFLPL